MRRFSRLPAVSSMRWPWGSAASRLTIWRRAHRPFSIVTACASNVVKVAAGLFAPSTDPAERQVVVITRESTATLIDRRASAGGVPTACSAHDGHLVSALERLLQVGEDLLLSGPLGIERQVDGARRLPLPHGVLVLLGRDQPVVAQHREQGGMAMRHRMEEQLDVLDRLQQRQEEVALRVVHAQSQPQSTM